KKATVRFGDRGALWQTLINPGLHFGDLYSAGRIVIHGDLMLVLDEAYRYLDMQKPKNRLLESAKRIAPDLSESKRNIHHHYDLGNDFYKLWLDRDWMQYTCAYYPEADITIEQSQAAKLHHVARKLRLKPGESIVEAGGGWGGLAIFMAKHYGVNVRSFNISKEQIAYSREWAERESLSHLVEFVEDDFRNISGTYDAFVSVGMLEHVGPGNYEEMGRLMHRSITPEGRGLVHSIGRDRQGHLNQWIDKRIFPGAHPPTIREMMDLFEATNLSVLDIENIRLHYAKTLEGWLERYEDNIETVRKMFDEPFVRAWRLYLAGSITAFLRGKLQLFQVVFTRSAMNNIPATRKHIYVDGE
ncbi:MAG: cyclopropane-fatty-acyl-phospholipid synthase family protein, partial [Gammaproteobacteria bacterium]|nr:cyclopropane-fatty-acyl-phospholipid synthase family protein [Gammaproteobacteria bacterium]